jgi:transglutaminase-like putative cysteine protease
MLERRFQKVLLANVLLSLVGYGVAEADPLIFVALVALAVSGWWVTARMGRWAGLPKSVGNTILLALLVVTVARVWWFNTFLVSAFSSFLAAILVLKMWERRQLRDYGQMLSMSLFLIIGATLTDSGVWLGLTLLVQTPVLITAVVLFQLHSARVRAAPAEVPPARPDGPERAMWKPLAILISGSLIAGVVIGGIVFVMIPRNIGYRQWGDLGRPTIGRVSGFSSAVDLSAGGLITESQATVMEVSLLSADRRRTLGGQQQPYYLRGAILERYDRGAWLRRNPVDPVEGTSTMGHWEVRAGQEINLAPNAGASGFWQFVSLRTRPSGDMPVFTIYKPGSVSFQKVDEPVRVDFNPDTSGIFFQTNSSRVDYAVRVVRAPMLDEPPARRAGVSFESEPIRELAESLLRQAGQDPDPGTRPVDEDGAATRVFETYLRSNFRYSLDVGTPPPGDDATEWFLFTKQEGHCEFFASALCAMCRAVGIDARVIAGYYISEYDDDRGAYIVRASNAHAWVEVDTGRAGWQVRDATPPADLMALREKREGLLARLSRTMESVQNAWNSSFVTFDRSTQDRILGINDRGSGFLNRVADAIRDKLDVLREGGDATRTALRMGLRAGAVIIGVGLIWVVWRWRARRVRAIAAGVPGWAMEDLGAYRDLLRFLRSRGFEKPSWQPPLNFLREVAMRDSALAARAEEVVRLLYSARFGREAAAASRAGDMVRDLRRESRRA